MKINDKLRYKWMKEGAGLTYEDYYIYVCLTGHENYRRYNTAHWRDSDIMDKTNVWKALQYKGPVEQKEMLSTQPDRSGHDILGTQR